MCLSCQYNQSDDFYQMQNPFWFENFLSLTTTVMSTGKLDLELNWLVLRWVCPCAVPDRSLTPFYASAYVVITLYMSHIPVWVTAEKGDLSCMATHTPNSVTGHFVTPSAGVRWFTKLCFQRFPSRNCCLSAVGFQLPAVLFLWPEFQGPGNGGDKHLSNNWKHIHFTLSTQCVCYN